MGQCTSDQSTPNADADSRWTPEFSPKASSNTCPVCLEVKPLSFQYTPEQSEHYVTRPCTHMFCEECLPMYVNMTIESLKHDVKCPMPQCSYVLNQTDVSILATGENYERWMENKKGNHLERFLKNDPEILEMMNVERELTWYEERVAEEKEWKAKEEERKAKDAQELEKWKKVDKGFEVVHGARITATYLSNTGRRYPGTVVEVYEDADRGRGQLVAIQYDDGDFWGECPIANVQELNAGDDRNPRARATPQPPPFNHFRRRLTQLDRLKLEDKDIVQGMRVSAGWKTGTVWYPGTVRSTNAKARTAAIQYDDGDFWDAVPFSRIRDLKNEGSAKCCPKCYVVIVKSDGCDSMQCVCGNHFGWNGIAPVPDEILGALYEKREKEREEKRRKDEEEEMWREFEARREEEEICRKFLEAEREKKVAAVTPTPRFVTPDSSRSASPVSGVPGLLKGIGALASGLAGHTKHAEAFFLTPPVSPAKRRLGVDTSPPSSPAGKRGKGAGELRPPSGEREDFLTGVLFGSRTPQTVAS